jgi:hypothetical protein
MIYLVDQFGCKLHTNAFKTFSSAVEAASFSSMETSLAIVPGMRWLRHHVFHPGKVVTL